jgi:hypothetical protein
LPSNARRHERPRNNYSNHEKDTKGATGAKISSYWKRDKMGTMGTFFVNRKKYPKTHHDVERRLKGLNGLATT